MERESDERKNIPKKTQLENGNKEWTLQNKTENNRKWNVLRETKLGLDSRKWNSTIIEQPSTKSARKWSQNSTAGNEINKGKKAQLENRKSNVPKRTELERKGKRNNNSITGSEIS